MADTLGMEPLIAVAGRPVAPGKVADWPAVGGITAPAPYVEALRRAGARAAVLSPESLSDASARSLLKRFDGLLLMGGGDVDPGRYGAEPHTRVYGIDPERDSFEIALVRAAVAEDVPTLAICRGAQILNVALGGTLDQHIDDVPDRIEHGKTRDDWARHAVDVEAGSLPAKAMEAERAECVSHHHQAIDTPGEGIDIVGWAEDGIVEAVVVGAARWIVGVQWHPEVNASTDPAQQGLFNALQRESGS